MILKIRVMRKAVQPLYPAPMKVLVILAIRNAVAVTRMFIVKSFAGVLPIVREGGRGVHARAANLAPGTDVPAFEKIENVIPIFA